MSATLWGAGLVLASSLWGLRTYCVQRRRRRETVWAFAAALGTMESGIRWQRTPLLTLLEGLQTRAGCGAWFREVLEEVESGTSLQDAWSSVFESLEDRETGEILGHLTLCGDGERLVNALGQARQELESLHARRREEDRQRTKVAAAAAVCGAGCVIILLI